MDPDGPKVTAYFLFLIPMECLEASPALGMSKSDAYGRLQQKTR